MGLEKLNKKQFNLFSSLLGTQGWLLKKEAELFSLINEFDNDNESLLLKKLLMDFNYLSNETYHRYLNLIANHIVNYSGFDEDKTLISAITADNNPDSSQKVINDIKIYFPIYKWNKVTFNNNFTRIEKYHNKGKNQIVLIDEFSGSGKTIKSRIKNLEKLFGKGNFELIICYVAGVEFFVDKIEKLGYEFFYPLKLKRGIADLKNDDEIVDSCISMQGMENKLSRYWGDKDIRDYKFGYGKAEALYILENSNIPNSVFPIFWWKLNKKNEERMTLFTRYE